MLYTNVKIFYCIICITLYTIKKGVKYGTGEEKKRIQRSTQTGNHELLREPLTGIINNQQRATAGIRTTRNGGGAVNQSIHNQSIIWLIYNC